MALDPIRERAAEKRAHELISQLAISDVEDLDVEAIAMTQKAVVVYGGLSGAEARLSRSPRLSFIRVNDAIPESGRKRFAIAHELGHLLLQDGSQLALCSDRELIGFYTNSPEELEANAFAAALLMPAALFGPLPISQANSQSHGRNGESFPGDTHRSVCALSPVLSAPLLPGRQ